MGNCNFKTEKETDNVTCKLSFILSNVKELFPVPLCGWSGRIWKSVEGGNEKDQAYLCNEGNAQSPNSGQEECSISHQREKDPSNT